MATTRKYDLKKYGRCYVVNCIVYHDSKPVLDFWLRTYPSVSYSVESFEPYLLLLEVNRELSLFITRATRIVQAGFIDESYIDREDEIENRLFL